VATVLILLPGSAPLKGWLVVAVIAVWGLFVLINWQCPKCSSFLPPNFALLGEACPNCGVVLNPHDSIQGMLRTLLRLLGGPPA